MLIRCVKQGLSSLHSGSDRLELVLADCREYEVWSRQFQLSSLSYDWSPFDRTQDSMILFRQTTTAYFCLLLEHISFDI